MHWQTQPKKNVQVFNSAVIYLKKWMTALTWKLETSIALACLFGFEKGVLQFEQGIIQKAEKISS